MSDSQNNHYLSELLPAGTPVKSSDAVTEYDDAGLVILNNLTATASNGYLNLSMNLTNVTDTEAIIAMENLTLNGIPAEFTAEAYGNGENWGLLPDESALLPCMIPAEKLDGIETLTEITFDLTLKNAADPDETLGTVPVHVTVSIDLSGLR